MGIINRVIASHAPCSTLLVRLSVGATFLVMGIQALRPFGDSWVGRFTEIRIPHAEVVVGLCEIVCGAMLIVGLLTRLASIALIENIATVILATRIPLLLGKDVWIFSCPKADSYGFWSMMHDAPTDFIMLLSLMFLLIVGAGGLSIDGLLARRFRLSGARPHLPPPRAWAGLDLCVPDHK
jgi:putative oxidoreductase